MTDDDIEKYERCLWNAAIAQEPENWEMPIAKAHLAEFIRLWKKHDQPKPALQALYPRIPAQT